MKRKRLYQPELFQGVKKKKNYFEGWYYKLVSKDKQTEIAFIPGVSLNGDPHSFIQIYASMAGGKTLTKTYHGYGLDDFKYQDDPFSISIRDNIFSLDGLSINLVDEAMSVTGKIDIHSITPFKRSFLTPNIMGFFGYLNFMECYHGLVSMNSSISGTLDIDDTPIDFNESKLYIEKDWGKSFPKAYVWMQSNHFKDESTNFMFSYAHIPFLGLSFKGLICLLNIGEESYLFSTYNRGRVKSEVIADKMVSYIIKKGALRLHIEAIQKETVKLASPKRGAMIEEIKEGLSGQISLKLFKNDALIFEDTGYHAGIEIMKKQTK